MSRMDPSVIAGWEEIRRVREIANKKIEEKRAAGLVGSSLQAELDIYTISGPALESMKRLGDDLRFVFITSRATVHHREGAALGVDVAPSAHKKCERCWHYRADVGADTAHPEICGRCVSNLSGPGESRAYA
jgi:isoleucyl-tRNA synthetase